eukprot:TRINITY_DN42887_c0_g1_i1.p1 TRINITY_DN42887_c0_g1~~TRINITY_DN42887_c0_g1_i1.p1  ORF type:complete len:113 (+),score=11.82 TRINITY_DN42887_c0_g1_i1:41-340(+)
MNTAAFVFVSLMLWACVTKGSVLSVRAANGGSEEVFACDVSPQYAYCVDLVNSELPYLVGEQEADKFIVQLPLGDCSWREWKGTMTFAECAQLIEHIVD